MTRASPHPPTVQSCHPCQSTPPGPSSWSHPAAPDTTPAGHHGASTRTPATTVPQKDGDAARSSPTPEGPRRGQYVAYSFDEIDHTALMGRVRRRIGDKRVLGLVKAFLRAGVLTEDGRARASITGTPQGGILSPLLANIALSVLDEHFARKWEALGPEWTRAKLRRAGVPAMRLVRYADDCVPRTRGGIDVEGRTQQVVLCQRWRLPLRDRPAGGGLKPPQAASVKSRGGERCGNGAPTSASGVS
jgi:reverse transcriptase-like protein